MICVFPMKRCLLYLTNAVSRFKLYALGCLGNLVFIYMSFTPVRTFLLTKECPRCSFGRYTSLKLTQQKSVGLYTCRRQSHNTGNSHIEHELLIGVYCYHSRQYNMIIRCCVVYAGARDRSSACLLYIPKMRSNSMELTPARCH